MTTLVTKNLHLVAAAPGGVRKLRHLILKLAVRGRLVEQDSSDEPANELLKRIQAEKARLTSSGESRRKRSEAVGAIDGVPEALPATWVWTALPNIYSSIPIRGNQLLSSEIAVQGRFPVVDQGKQFIAGYTDKEDLLIRIPGPVVVFGDHTTERKYIDFDFVAGADGVKILRPILLNERFFWWQLVSLELEGRGYARHFKVLNECSFALPPVNEQARIVAKVDELMALCDRLEAEQADAEAAHAKLVEALLASLTQARDAADFRASWQQLSEHFHTLFTTEASVDALKQAIREQAVRGRLTNDVPSFQLTNSTSVEAAGPFSLPKSWHWVKLKELVLDIRFGTSTKCTHDGPGTPVLRIPNIGEEVVTLLDMKFGELSDAEKQSYLLEQGDLLMIRSNGSASLVGKTAIVGPDATHCAFAGYLVRIRLPRDRVTPEYFQLALRSRHVRDGIEAPIRTTSGVKNINSTEIRGLQVPLPPMHTQVELVAKVNELLTLCDQLKLNLSQAHQHHEKLASVLVEQAVA